MRLPLFFSVSTCLLLLFSSACYRKWNPQRYVKAEIVDPGEIYSTWNLEKRNDNNKQRNRIFLLKRRWLPDSVFRVVANSCNESRWVAAIRTPQQRFDNRGKIRNYNAYIVTSFGGKHILYIPGKQNNKNNTKLPQELAVDKDFYMIVGKKGVERLRPDSLYPEFKDWKRPPFKTIRKQYKTALGELTPPSPSVSPKDRNNKDAAPQGVPNPNLPGGGGRIQELPGRKDK